MINLNVDWKLYLGENLLLEAEKIIERIDEFERDTNSTSVPKKSLYFEALNQCSPENVNVVILGQDPYPTPGHAHGLAFSVEKTVKPNPKSLINVFKELKTAYPDYNPENGNLERWAKQGVLLLNSSLSTQVGIANAHQKLGWNSWTDQIIEKLGQSNKPIVFILWGNNARLKKKLISNLNHLILEAPHPSPLSAYHGFFGCAHFTQTNNFLVQNNRKGIRW